MVNEINGLSCNPAPNVAFQVLSNRKICNLSESSKRCRRTVRVQTASASARRKGGRGIQAISPAKVNGQPMTSIPDMSVRRANCRSGPLAAILLLMRAKRTLRKILG